MSLRTVYFLIKEEHGPQESGVFLIIDIASILNIHSQFIAISYICNLYKARK